MAEKSELIAIMNAALLHESLTRAAKIAPTKGEAHDKAGGIRIEFAALEAHVQATNLDMTFYQKVPADVKQATTIRFGLVIQQFVAGLPMDRDQEIRFLRKGKQVVVQYGKTRTKATVSQILGEYPHIPWHDPDDGMLEAHELASKLQAVAWAIDEQSAPPICGVRIDGEWLEGLTSKQAARIKAEIPVDVPVNAMLKELLPLVRIATDLKMKAEAGKIILALDETAQVTSTTVLGPWPNLSSHMAKMEFTDSMTIPKKRLAEGLERMLGFVRNDRLPRVFFVVTEDSIDLSLIGSINGQIQDSCRLVDRQGPEIEKPVEFIFNPIWLKEAVESFPGSTIKIKFTNPLKPLLMEEPSTSYQSFFIGMRNVDND